MLNVFAIIVRTFLLTITWCSMMWMDYTLTHLKLKERLVLLKAYRVIFLIFIEVSEVLKAEITTLLVWFSFRVLLLACRICFFLNLCSFGVVVCLHRVGQQDYLILDQQMC